MSSGQNQGEKKGRCLQVTFNIQIGTHQHIENHQNSRGNGYYGADKRNCSNPNSDSFANEKSRNGGPPSTEGEADLAVSEIVSTRREPMVQSTLPLEDEDRRSRGISYLYGSGRPAASRTFGRSTISRPSSGNTYYTDERSRSLDNGKSTLCSRFRRLFGSRKENRLEEIREPDPQPRKMVGMIPRRQQQTYVFEAPPAPPGAPQAKEQVEKVQEDETKSKGKTFHENCTCKKEKPYHEICTRPSASCKCDDAFAANIARNKREQEFQRVKESEQRVDGEEFPIP